MSKFIFTSLLFCFYTISYGQPKIEYGPTVDLSSNGAVKILQLKNGNTFLFHFSKKGIEVAVYSNSRQITSTQTLLSGLWDASEMPNSMLKGLYEIDNQPVIFLSQVKAKEYSLFRIILDPLTGKIVAEKKLKTYSVSTKFNFMKGFNNAADGDFDVEKDPYTDFYAIAYINYDASDINDKIKLSYYNGLHKRISTAYLKLPENKYKYVHFVGMTVLGDKQITVCTYAYNSKTKGNDDAHIILSNLVNGDSVLTSKELSFTENFWNTEAIMKYNKSTGLINLLTVTSNGRSHNEVLYTPIMSYIDPQTLYVSAMAPLSTDKISEYSKAHLGKASYTGLPEDMIINPDNSVTILWEENTVIAEISKQTKYYTYLDDIGIDVLKETGKERDGIAIPKQQFASGEMDPLYLFHKKKDMWSYNNNGFSFSSRGFEYERNYNAYLSFDYIVADGNKYIIFNDRKENFGLDEKEKRKVLKKPNEANTVYYAINKDSLQEFYLFGKTEDGQNQYCNIEASDFLPRTKTYCTLVTSHDESRLAWIQFN